MWAPILANFFQIIFVIFGFFGTYHYRPGYVAAYITWTLLWIGWNVFVICLYMEIGALSRDSNILNMGTGSRSWWEANGFGCMAIFNYSSSDDILAVTKPVSVNGCLLEYYYVECVQAGVQCLLAVVGFIGGCYLIYLYTQEDDSFTQKRRSSKRKPLNSLPYSIEFRTDPPANDAGPAVGPGLGRAPMTPRRVKRRSTRSKRSSGQTQYQNPVTRLLDRSLDTSSNDSYAHFGGQCNPTYLGSRTSLHSLYGKANPNLSGPLRTTHHHSTAIGLPSARQSTRGRHQPYVDSSETMI
uniref:Sodium/potassium-transporting ATPase subunit beta-1-interacting protein n=1 Tax=Amblyomma aureolatum TaxID=187763 RepID=A0A1E1X7R1_9ACAR